MTTLVAKLKATVVCDQVSKLRDGTYIFRRGYFYRHGNTADDFKSYVLGRLHKSGIKFDLVEYGDKWTPFNGGATLARSSHFFVQVAIKPDDDGLVRIYASAIQQ